MRFSIVESFSMSSRCHDHLSSGAALAVDALLGNGTNIVFGLPGIQLDALFSAFYDRRDALRLIDTRHEQGAAYMALGFAEASGKPGVFTVVPGPGLLNAGAALSTAYACGSPVVALIGQIDSKNIGGRLGDLHELPDQSGILERLVRAHDLVASPAEVPAALRQALEMVKSAGQGPVALELPPDVLAAETDTTAGAGSHLQSDTVPSDEVSRLCDMIAAAHNPLIFAGRGALHAAEPLARIARRIGVPVVAQGRAKGILPDSDPLALTLLGAADLWKGCDLVIAVGTRMRHALQAWERPPGVRIAAIDIDPTSAPAAKVADLLVQADARAALEALEAALPDQRRAAVPAVAEARSRARTRMEEELTPQMGFLRAIRQALGSEGRIVTDYTQIGYVAAIGYSVDAPGRLITSGYQGTLGYAFPTALGAKIAMPDKRVAAIVGDGGFMFTATELATAVKHRIGLVTLLFNDGKFGNVRRIQETVYGGRVIATDLVNPDFQSFVHSFGARAAQVHTPEELVEAMEEAFDSNLPTVIEIPVGEFPDPWPLIFPAVPAVAAR
jgi:acetolactate synthase-1/2/3 large subunit